MERKKGNAPEGEAAAEEQILLADEVASLKREICAIRQVNPDTDHVRIMWRKLPRLEVELAHKRARLAAMSDYFG